MADEYLSHHTHPQITYVQITIIKFINDKFKKIDFIFNTHHHYDHTGGNIDLKKKYNCKIIGSKVDINRIPGIDIALNNHDGFDFGEINFKIILVPGHTLGHICYFSEKENKLKFKKLREKELRTARRHMFAIEVT